MNHKPRVVAIILLMFIITQFIGLGVINYYSNQDNLLPYGMGFTPEMGSSGQGLGIIMIAFVIAITIFVLLTNVKAEFFIRMWFFFVVIIALGIFFYSLTKNIDIIFYEIPIIATLIGLLFAFFKVFQRNIVIHNFTELLIYPGIAAVFVPILNRYSVMILLVLISIYDVWAVWHSKIMIKMAKYQINKVKAFSGFFVPYISKKVGLQIQRMKNSKSKMKNAKIRINVAILGGGDVIFPIITAGVFLNAFGTNILQGLFYSMFVIFGAAGGLFYLFLRSEKKKYYPAMPFITAGIFLGLLVGWLFSLI